MDINMPVMDGFAVARQLRQHGCSRHITIVAFTAQDESTIRSNGTAVGFDAYCQKRSGPNASIYLFRQIGVYLRTSRRAPR
jgi:two-component system OmpR family response regulator